MLSILGLCHIPLSHASRPETLNWSTGKVGAGLHFPLQERLQLTEHLLTLAL